LNDYKTQFSEDTAALIATNIADRTERMAAVHALIDRYIEANGEVPDRAQLERLTDYILREELTDRNRMKSREEEYPFLSERQMDRRYESEYAEALAEDYDSNGRNCAKPERRHRIAKEQRFIDRKSQQENRARNRQYKRDTSPGEVITYNLRENDGKLTDSFVQCCGIIGRLA
jgi:hypothetical protein